jgi:serine/threonine protein kinase
MGCTLTSQSSSLSNPNDFIYYEKIGEGGFATIFRSSSKQTNSMVATKIINIKTCCSRRGGQEMLRGELDALKALTSHPFVAKLYSAFHNFTSCYLIFELLEGGDLRYHLTSEYHFTEKMIAFLAGCVASALHHIHSCGVLHRDIKPENIVFDVRGIPKLIDFGIAYVCPDPGQMICVNCSGTRLYSAPELFTPTHAHGPSADFWALGLVLYEMLFLSHPFHRHCPRDFMKFASKYSLFCERAQTTTMGGIATTTSKGNQLTRNLSTTMSKNREALWVMGSEQSGGGGISRRDSGQLGSTHCSQRPYLPPLELPCSVRGDAHDDLAPAPVVVSPPSPSPGGGVGLLDSENTYKSLGISVLNELEDFDEFDALILPSRLRVPLPTITAYGEAISMGCLEFIDELLDIRHDRRLGGTDTRYADLVRHHWLQANGIHIPNLVNTFMANTSPQTHTHTYALQHQHGGGLALPSTLISTPATSPIKLNHDALKFYILKRQQENTAMGTSPHSLLTQHLNYSSLLKCLKPHRVIPQEYAAEVLEILDSYQYSADQ